MSIANQNQKQTSGPGVSQVYIWNACTSFQWFLAKGKKAVWTEGSSYFL